MSSAAAVSPPPRAIRSARSLFEGLRAPDPFDRVEVLRAIQNEPAVALSFGIFEGQDVIDALIRESHRGAGTLEWMQWLGTLDCFEDPRARDFFLRLLCENDEAMVLFAAARHLARTPVTSHPESIYDLLLTNENPMRARAAALVLENSQATSVPDPHQAGAVIRGQSSHSGTRSRHLGNLARGTERRFSTGGHERPAGARRARVDTARAAVEPT